MHKPVPMQLLVSNDELTADLHIMGDIRQGNFWDSFDESGDATVRKTDSLDMTRALENLPGTVGQINVHINSYGGEVAEGLAIYNALKAHPAKVTTICEGFACSIASVVFMAGDERIMRDSSMLMIHNPSLAASGTADELRKVAEGLDAIREASITAYMAHATVERSEIVALMDAESWITPQRAIEMGLATEQEDDEETDAPTQSARRHVMEALTGRSVCIDVVAPQFDTEQMARAIAEQLAQLIPTQDAETTAKAIADADDDPEEPDDEPNEPEEATEGESVPTAAQRFSRIFQQLAD